MYIASHLSYKTRSALNIHKKFKLESKFAEIITPKKSSIIADTIYRRPKVDVTKFNNILNNILKKKSRTENSVSFRRF